MRIRPKNKFGCRFISLQQFRDYAVDLDLGTRPPRKNFMEFLEREGLLTPVARVQLSPEILRRFAQEDTPEKDVFLPVEPDGPILDAAVDTIRTVSGNRWNDARIYGESDHPLDVVDDDHAPFVVKTFSTDTFIPWKEIRTPVYEHAGKDILSSERYSPSYYHYWQIFWLATIMRSGVTVHYPLDNEDISRTMFRGELGATILSGRMQMNINIEARHQLNELRSFSSHFDAVGYFNAYRHHALQVYAYDRNQETGRLSFAATRAYRRREREIAKKALNDSGLSSGDLVAFITKQTEWWDYATRIGPAAIADEYKHNISSSLQMHRLVTKTATRKVVERVGRRGHFRPILEVIFPDWIDEQRDLAIRSLKGWADANLRDLPAPFRVTEAEIGEFGDWLEAAGLYQYYWHFKRVVDVGLNDAPVDRATTAAEAVGFANICEMIANRALEDRGEPANRRAGARFRQSCGRFSVHMAQLILLSTFLDFLHSPTHACIVLLSAFHKLIGSAREATTLDWYARFCSC